MAKAIGCTVYTTVGDDEKGRKAKELGADFVVNYKTERFEGEVRQMTKRKGVDVVFEHVAPTPGTARCSASSAAAGSSPAARPRAHRPR